jgi:hypothetical protein
MVSCGGGQGARALGRRRRAVGERGEDLIVCGSERGEEIVRGRVAGVLVRVQADRGTQKGAAERRRARRAGGGVEAQDRQRLRALHTRRVPASRVAFDRIARGPAIGAGSTSKGGVVNAKDAQV